MNLDDLEDAHNEASAPIDMLESYFQAHGWTCERMGEDEVRGVLGAEPITAMTGLIEPAGHVVVPLARPAAFVELVVTPAPGQAIIASIAV